jgi:hypothetical protein
VRGFARYMAGINPRTEIPPTGLIRFRQQRRPPYIYTDAEILALMAQARTGIRQALCAATYETLIGLLAATGMRISEAIKLDRTDIDWARACCSSASRSSTSRATCPCTRPPWKRSSATRAGATSSAPSARRELLRVAEAGTTRHGRSPGDVPTSLPERWDRRRRSASAEVA